MTAGPLTAPREAKPGRRRRSSPGWWTAAALVLLPALVPPFSLLWQVVTKGAGALPPLDRLTELFTGTLALTVAVTATSLSIGTATAWLTSRTDIPGRRTWMILAALPLVIPSYMAALTIIGATGPAGLLSNWFGFEIPTPFGFVGAWLALSIFLAPMAHLIVTPALRLIDPALEDAATGLGASRARAFFTVTLPLLRPALVSAGLMAGLYTISDFGAVSLLRFDTFTRAIFTLYAGQIDRRPAAALSLVLMALALAILFLERRTRSKAGYHLASTSRRRNPFRLRGWSRAGSLAFLGGYAAVSLALPVGVILFWLFRGMGAGAELGSFWAETARSVEVSLAAALVAAAVALPVAMVTTWKRGRYHRRVVGMGDLCPAPHHRRRRSGWLRAQLGTAVLPGVDSLIARLCGDVHGPVGVDHPGFAQASEPRARRCLTRAGSGSARHAGAGDRPPHHAWPGSGSGARVPFGDEGAPRDAPAPPDRVRNACNSHLERHRGRILHTCQCRQPRSRSSLDRATLGPDLP